MQFMLEHQWPPTQNWGLIHQVSLTLYKSMIGCLLYLTVGVCARFQANPKMSPLTTVKRIIKYVNGTCDYGLFCSKESNVSLVGYFDVDWAGNADDRKKHY